MNDYDLTDPAGKALAVLDEAALREITEAAGMSPMELIEMFIDDATSTVAAMEAAMLASDRETFNRSAHTLKSSAGNVGAQRIAAICRDLEKLTKQNLGDESNNLLAQLAAEIDAFQRLVNDNHIQLSS